MTQHTVNVYAQIYSVAASGAANASIADLLADVRRLKAAGDSIRAVRSRPATAASQGRAVAAHPRTDPSGKQF